MKHQIKRLLREEADDKQRKLMQMCCNDVKGNSFEVEMEVGYKYAPYPNDVYKGRAKVKQAYFTANRFVVVFEPLKEVQPNDGEFVQLHTEGLHKTLKEVLTTYGLDSYHVVTKVENY